MFIMLKVKNRLLFSYAALNFNWWNDSYFIFYITYLNLLQSDWRDIEGRLSFSILAEMLSILYLIQ